MATFKTWIEISKSTVAANVATFRALVAPTTRIWAVAKSNAYGHGFSAFSSAADAAGVDGFCVDSVPEALKLRSEGIAKPILVLGPTLPNLFADAAAGKITLSFSTAESLERLVKVIPDPAARPDIQIKIDTGMQRRGFYLDALAEITRFCVAHQLRVTGVFSHFAAAKDMTYTTYSLKQLEQFEQAVTSIEKNGLRNFQKHIAATGGAMVSPEFHLDAVRIGIGLYGLFPSRELEMQRSQDIKLQPALSWHAVVSEIKQVPKDEFIGYDLTERLTRDTRIAIIPIGYWHGLPWALSGIGQVLIGGQRCKILGRVSMDMIVVDVTDATCAVGDTATLIGRQGSEQITAREIASKINTSPYEIITRINPLIERIVVE